MEINESIGKSLRLAYFLGVCLLLASLPFSFYFTSASIFLLILIWVSSCFVLPMKARFKSNPEVFLFILIFGIHLIWLWNTSDFEYAFQDIIKKLPLLVLPIIFSSMPAFGRVRIKFILNFFVLVMFAAGVSVMLAYFEVLKTDTPNPRDYSVFISHIRLSLMIVLSMFISAWFIRRKYTENIVKFVHLFALLFNILVLIVLQAFTGIAVFIIAFFILAPYEIRKIKSKSIKRISYSAIIIVGILFIGLISSFIYSFYHAKNPYPENKNIKTSLGNPYKHYCGFYSMENGNRVFDFLSLNELKTAWNEVSNIKYNSLDNSGNEIKYTLMRYLTSKGEYKDAEAVGRLSKYDISAIENGNCNVRFVENKGVSSRLYFLIWQIYDYWHGGNPSGQSVTQRFEYSRIGWKIFTKHPLLGVGTGDVDKEFKKQYRIGNSLLIPEYRHRAHNQFLTMLIAFGIPGFLLFLLAWFGPVVSRKGIKNYFFSVFFIIANLSMITEDTFETLTGSVFIATFYSLFLWGFNNKSMFQEDIMRKAIEMAKDNISKGHGPFGAIIVKDGEILSLALNSVTQNNDPTAHAEVNAIRKACDKLGTFDLSGCELYSSCEPCPMCLGAIYWAQIDKLYYASSRQDAASAGFSDEFIYKELEKEIHERTIPTQQMMQKEADVVFQTWSSYAEKIKY